MAHTNPPAASAGHGDPHAPHVANGHGAVNHETSDIPLGGTTRAALFTAGGLGLVAVLMWGAWGFFLSQARQGDPGKPEMAPADYGARVPATPRLQSAPGTDLKDYRAQQAEKLDGLAWVDQSAGTVRLPIYAAMQLIVQRADTFADQQAKPPVEHSWAFPGAAMTGRAAEPSAPSLPEHSPSPVLSPGTAELPQPHTTAPSEQDKPQPAPPRH
jgi:hypothetical protein